MPRAAVRSSRAKGSPMCADRDDGADQAPHRRPYGWSAPAGMDLGSKGRSTGGRVRVRPRMVGAPQQAYRYFWTGPQRASGVVALSDEESTTAPVASTSS